MKLREYVFLSNYSITGRKIVKKVVAEFKEAAINNLVSEMDHFVHILFFMNRINPVLIDRFVEVNFHEKCLGCILVCNIRRRVSKHRFYGVDLTNDVIECVQ